MRSVKKIDTETLGECQRREINHDIGDYREVS